MTYEPKPFPRMLYLGQAHTIVHNEDEEAAKVSEGWGNFPEPVGQEPKPDTNPQNAPAPCAKCAELEAKVQALEAQLAKAKEPVTGVTAKAPPAPPAPARGTRGKAKA